MSKSRDMANRGDRDRRDKDDRLRQVSGSARVRATPEKESRRKEKGRRSPSDDSDEDTIVPPRGGRVRDARDARDAVGFASDSRTQPQRRQLATSPEDRDMDYSRRRSPSGQRTQEPRYNDYFLPEGKLSLEVLKHDIPRYLDRDATVKRYTHKDVRQIAQKDSATKSG